MTIFIRFTILFIQINLQNISFFIRLSYNRNNSISQELIEKPFNRLFLVSDQLAAHLGADISSMYYFGSICVQVEACAICHIPCDRNSLSQTG